MSHPRNEDSFDNMMNHMSKNDALVRNLEQVSQMNKAQCDPVIIQMATELSRELNTAKQRRVNDKIASCVGLIVFLVAGAVYLAVKLGGEA